jgi:invasion protein IalB
MDIFRLAAFLALLMVFASNASGQPVPHHRENAAWKKFCFEGRKDTLRQSNLSPPQPEGQQPVEACFIYADLFVPEANVTFGVVGVLQLPATGRSFLVAFFACDAEPREAGLLLDDAQAKPEYLMPIRMCDAACCYASIEIPRAFLERMKAAKAISLVASRFENVSHSHPLPCCNFGAALDGTPAAADGQDEQQLRVKTELEQRFENLTP